MRLPGFIDSHLHVLGIGYYQSIIDLSELTSVEKIIEKVKDFKHLSMIIGRGWNQDQFEESRSLTKEDLNQISTEIPIILTRVCGHVLVANDCMIKMAGIHQDSKQVSGGHFDFHRGIFSEKAMDLIYRNIPRPSKETIKSYFLKANDLLVANGITSVASDDFCVFDVDYKEIIEALKELYEDGLMKVKITEQVNLPLEKLKDFIEHGYVNQIIHPKFKMGPLKILADGSLGGRTAAMLEPYTDMPEEMGILTYSDHELFELINLADRFGMDSVIHAIGDKTSLQAIKMIEKSQNITGRFDNSHAIIHAQLTPRNQIDLMKMNHIGAIVQPIFMNTDIKIIADRIGDRKTDSYLYRSMYDEINLGFSTDAPIEPVNPFFNIYTAMTNKSIKYPDLPSFNEAERFTLEEALKAYTVNNLPYIYQNQIGDDYIEIDRDIFSITVDEIKEIKVLKTVIDGEKVFSIKS